MKAIIQNEFGDAAVLSYAEVEIPEIKNGQCLIKVAYTSVNYADIKARKGNKGKGDFPLTLGLDLAGTVVEITENASFSVGDRVVAFAKNGSYAQYAVADEKLMYKIPDTLGFEQAAAMPTISFLSYILLHEISQVEKKHTIVIHSAAGGVGSMLVQLAKLAGVRKIVGTVGDMKKEGYVIKMGADVVCTYDNFHEIVLRETNEKGANIIFDSMAGEVTTKSLECLARFGTLVQFGNSSGKTGFIKTSDVHSSCRNVKGFSLGTTRKYDPSRISPVAVEVIKLFATGEVQVPIVKVFKLEDASDAHKLMESRKHKGKILLKVGN